MHLKQFGEFFVAHLLQLFTLVAMHTRPDIQQPRPGLRHLGYNRLERQGAVHTGGENVVETEFLLGPHQWGHGQGGCG